MSTSLKYAEDQDGVYVAIPPSLVPPLVRQLASSNHDIRSESVHHLPTPAPSTNNSSTSQASTHWAFLDNQYRRGVGPLDGGAENNGNIFEPGVESGSEPGSDSRGHANSEGAPVAAAVSPGMLPPASTLPVQLLNRLYSFTTMTNTQNPTDVTSTSNIDNTSNNTSSITPSLQRRASSNEASIRAITAASRAHSNNASNYNYTRSIMQYPGLSQTSDFSRTGTGAAPIASTTTESTRLAAAAALVSSFSRQGSVNISTNEIGIGADGFATVGTNNTEGAGRRASLRGESAYIPSSLSMLFSDPEVMQAQSEVTERALLHQHEQQLRQRYRDSRRSFSFSGVATGNEGANPGIGSNPFGPPGRRRRRTFAGEDVEEEEEEEEGGNNGGNGDQRPLLRRSQSEFHSNQSQSQNQGQSQGHHLNVVEGYGYEVVGGQTTPLILAGMVGDEDYEDGDYHPYATIMSRSDFLAPHQPSSSSPLFPSPLTTLGVLNDPLEEQQSYAAGGVWQDYNNMDHLRRIAHTNRSTPLNQSHATYYHSVSNYHYSSHGNGDGIETESRVETTNGNNSNTVAPCQPGNSPWRRLHTRGLSYQSYMTSTTTSDNNNNNSNNNRSSNNNEMRKHWFRRCQVSREHIREHWLCGP
ncbi:hypothetical protein BX616_004804, partial [Lobosporangium transversale]